jgi:hypothetical protein
MNFNEQDIDIDNPAVAEYEKCKECKKGYSPEELTKVTEEVFVCDPCKKEMEKTSNCCGATIIQTDICKDCGEHCGKTWDDYLKSRGNL